MPTTDPTFTRQLHADRTARLTRTVRVRLPKLSASSRFTRKERRRTAARLATTC
jgi:hypothetical protein